MAYLSGIIILLIILLVSFINTKINTRREIHFNEMKRIYDEMELYAFKNNLINDNATITYLIPFKIYSVNTGYADIQVLAPLFLEQKKKQLDIKKEKYERIIGRVSPQLKELGAKYDHHLKKAIHLSMYRAEFLLFILLLTVKAVMGAFAERSLKVFLVFFDSLIIVPKYENILIENSLEHFKKKTPAIIPC